MAVPAALRLRRESWGFAIGSLALLSDAGHMLSDAGALLVAVLASKIAERPVRGVQTRERDARDMNRSSAPLKPAEGAHLLDTSEMTVEQAVHQVLSWYAAI